MPTAVITGGTRGLGRALVEQLAEEGWSVIFDGRNLASVEAAVRSVGADPKAARTVGLAGDIAEAQHRAELRRSLGKRGLDLLVNNASSLGPTPLPRLADLDPDHLIELMAINSAAALAMFQTFREPLERGRGILINISSDAAVEAYEGWGGYGASKAALEQLTKVLAIEHPDLGVYAIDPGDMRTNMHQAAFPGEDISDRPRPESVVPSMMRLIHSRPPSGRYSAAELSRPGALR